MLKRFVTNQRYLLACFAVPILIMGTYFASRGMAPFGSSSILTVDLGQQYVDFFAYLRTSLLHHPSSLFYSFSKGFGGEMWGTNAYYLFSPLNLVLLFFPKQWLTSGILLLLLLKYGLASLSLGWLLQREGIQEGPRLLIFAPAYSMMGWMVANSLNLLWLDVLALLPLVVYGLLKISRQESPLPYIGWLTLLMIDNYYMAWMVALFTILFLIWQLSREPHPRRQVGAIVRTYLVSSLTSALLAAVILLPTVFALTQSKGTYTSTSFKWQFEYNPLKQIAKLVPGSFNFNQMPSGQANIYVGMLITLAALLYFWQRNERIRSRVIAGLVAAFLVASFFVEPLDLLWHLGQFPVWYPARFSYLLSFWLVWLAALTFQPGYRISKPQTVFLTLITLAVAATAWWLTKKVDYITTTQVAVGLALALAAIVCLNLEHRQLPAFTYALVALALFDSGYNATTALNNISYVSQAQFANYTLALDKAVEKLKKVDSGFYRVAKNFMRTKDDTMQADFFSGDHFGSTMEPTVSKFAQLIGQPAGDGYITYSNGTPVTDSLLGFKYLMSARNSGKDSSGNQVLPLTANRPDWKRQKTVAKTKLVTIRKNKWALPIAFGASAAIKKFSSSTLDPLAYQSELYQTLAGKGASSKLFSVQNFDHVNFANLSTSTKITGTTVKRVNLLAPAKLTLTIKPTTNDPYYLTIGAALKDNATIYLNGKELSQYATYQSTVVATIADHAKGKKVRVTIVLKKASLWLQNVSLYRLNTKAFKKSYQTLKQEPLKVTSWKSNQIKGTVTIKKKHQVLMTTIPYALGWHATVDGKTVKPVKVAGALMAIPITKGHHTVTLTYTPPYLLIGAGISLVTLAGVGTFAYRRKRRERRLEVKA